MELTQPVGPTFMMISALLAGWVLFALKTMRQVFEEIERPYLEVVSSETTVGQVQSVRQQERPLVTSFSVPDLPRR